MLHYFHDLFIFLDVVGAKDRIFNPYAAWDEFLWWVVSRFGGNDGLAVAVAVVDGLGEPGVTRFSLSYFLLKSNINCDRSMMVVYKISGCVASRARRGSSLVPLRALSLPCSG